MRRKSLCYKIFSSQPSLKVIIIIFFTNTEKLDVSFLSILHLTFQLLNVEVLNLIFYLVFGSSEQANDIMNSSNTPGSVLHFPSLMHFILECIHSAVPMVPKWLLNLRVINFHICINNLVNLLPFCRAL